MRNSINRLIQSVPQPEMPAIPGCAVSRAVSGSVAQWFIWNLWFTWKRC